MKNAFRAGLAITGAILSDLDSFTSKRKTTEHARAAEKSGSTKSRGHRAAWA